MGPRLICPASKLFATHNYTTSTLELRALGEIPVDWHNMYFHQEPFVGGMKFTLYAYGFYAGINNEKRPYDFTENFPVANIHIACPTGFVLICDQASPTTGEPVRIEPKFDNPVAATTDDTAATNSNSAKDASIVSPPEVTPSIESMGTAIPVQVKNTLLMGAVVNQPFTVQRSFPTNAERVDAFFDSAALMLQSASFVEPGAMQWTFVAHSPGSVTIDTSITMNNGVNSPVHYSQATTVQVVNPVVTNTANTDAAGSADVLAVQNFISRVIGGKKLVQAKYPDAKLLEVNARAPPPSHFPVESAADLTRLLCTFTAKDDKSDQGIATIECLTWNDWGNVVFKVGAWYKELPFDITSCMDILKASQIMRDHGQTEDLFDCTLRYPVYPPGAPNEPSYTFELVDGTAIVGAQSGSYSFYKKTT